MSIKMCFWVEVYMFFVLHNYYDTNIIFFVFVGLERKVFAIPQLSPMPVEDTERDQTKNGSLSLIKQKPAVAYPWTFSTFSITFLWIKAYMRDKPYGGGGGKTISVKYKTVSMRARLLEFFKTPSKRGFLSCQNNILKRRISARFSLQNLTSKGGLAQKFTPKSDRILTLLKNGCFWYPKHNIWVPSPIPPPKKNNPYSTFSWSCMLTVLYSTAPNPFCFWSYLLICSLVASCVYPL